MKTSRSQLVSRYKRLLVAEVSEDALREAVALSMAIIGGHGFPVPDVDRQLAEIERDEGLDAHERRHLAEDILEFMRNEREAQKVTRQARRVALARRRLLTEAAYCMSLPAWLETRAQHPAATNRALLLDTAALVFHQAYFGAWLDLGRGDEDLRRLLADHAMVLATRLPAADRARMCALVLEAAGQDVMADTFRDEALRLTSPDSHEYMTLLQSAWSALIERRRFPQAVLLLDREAPRVPEEHVDEFEELVLETTRSRRAA